MGVFARRSNIIRGALNKALRSEAYGPKILIREINKSTRDFVDTPETAYVMATGLSFRHFEDLTRIEPSGARLYVRERLPKHLAVAREEAKSRSRHLMLGNYPDEEPLKRYAAAWIHVRGRSVAEAMDRAVAALDLRRGIWNFALNRGSGVTFPSPHRGPINEVLAGPLFTLHHRDGTLATIGDWLDPEYSGAHVSRKTAQKWDSVEKDEEGIRTVLSRSPYREVLEDALRRYSRALDALDLSRSFLELWGLLETLTGIGPGDGYDKLVERASLNFAERERKTHEQVLYHLRRHRNIYAHAGEGSDRTGAYLHQVRRYAEKLLFFHLNTAGTFSSLETVTRFLDLPSETSQLRHEIRTREREMRKAAEGKRLAERGLRFREGS